MHFFVTGHTGFKGSWLILLLKELGHEVSGYSLPPVPGGLFDLAGLEKVLKNHFVGDIRDKDALGIALNACEPDFTIHLAAQPLVLRSYQDPIETYTTNVDGTRNFLEVITELPKPPVTLVVTTDKVYRDDNKGSYVESDPLGGHDPYSASKAMADILTQSWAATNPQLKLYVARAGNVIGSFDVSANRLIPDAVRSIKNRTTLRVRHPEAIRPWQHVLDCLGGYIRLLNAAAGGAHELPTALNFGPDPANVKSVSSLLAEIRKHSKEFEYEVEPHLSGNKETQLLTLDSRLAQKSLKWSNLIGFETAVAWSLSDFSAMAPLDSAMIQIRHFLKLDALEPNS